MTEQQKQAWLAALKERANQPGTYAVTGGMRLAELGDGWARGELQLEERHRNPMGIVHGGVYCTMMDQVAGSAACTRGSRYPGVGGGCGRHRVRRGYIYFPPEACGMRRKQGRFLWKRPCFCMIQKSRPYLPARDWRTGSGSAPSYRARP